MVLSRLANCARVLAGRAVVHHADPDSGCTRKIFRDGQSVRVFGEVAQADGKDQFSIGYRLLDPNGKVYLRGPENGWLNRFANFALRSPLEIRVPVRMALPDGRIVVENMLAVDLGVNEG